MWLVAGIACSITFGVMSAALVHDKHLIWTGYVPLLWLLMLCLAIYSGYRSMLASRTSASDPSELLGFPDDTEDPIREPVEARLPKRSRSIALPGSPAPRERTVVLESDHHTRIDSPRERRRP